MIIEVWRTELDREFVSPIKNGQLAISWFFFFTLNCWIKSEQKDCVQPGPSQCKSTEDLVEGGYGVFWILETGIAVAEHMLILWTALWKACVGCSGADPALPEPHNSPGAAGLRQAWEASAINPAPVLPSCLRAWRHLNAWDGFSTNTFSLKRIFPTFFKKKKKKVLRKQMTVWRLIDYLSTLRKKTAVNSFIPFSVWSVIYATVLSPDWEKLMTNQI